MAASAADSTAVSSTICPVPGPAARSWPRHTTPLVSVLMSLHRWGPFTAEALASILNQSMTQFELLLVLDPAAGQSAIQTIHARLPADRRIRCLVRAASGIVPALNTGLRAARGAYLARMDGDDVAAPERLAVQLDWLQTHPEAVLAAARVRIVDGSGATDSAPRAGNQRYEQWLNALVTPEAIDQNLFRECPVPHPTWFGPRSLFEQLGGWRDTPWPEDYDLVLRTAQRGWQWSKPPPVLLDWREHPSRLTRTDERYSRPHFARAKAAALAVPGHRLGLSQGRPVWLCGTGRHARDWYDALTACGIEVSGFVDLDRPGRSQHKRGRPVIAYSELVARRDSALLITALADDDARRNCIAFCIAQGLQINQDFIVGI